MTSYYIIILHTLAVEKITNTLISSRQCKLLQIIIDVLLIVITSLATPKSTWPKMEKLGLTMILSEVKNKSVRL